MGPEGRRVCCLATEIDSSGHAPLHLFPGWWLPAWSLLFSSGSWPLLGMRAAFQRAEPHCVGTWIWCSVSETVCRRLFPGAPGNSLVVPGVQWAPSREGREPGVRVAGNPWLSSSFSFNHLPLVWDGAGRVARKDLARSHLNGFCDVWCRATCAVSLNGSLLPVKQSSCSAVVCAR